MIRPCAAGRCGAGRCGSGLSFQVARGEEVLGRVLLVPRWAVLLLPGDDGTARSIDLLVRRALLPSAVSISTLFGAFNLLCSRHSLVGCTYANGSLPVVCNHHEASCSHRRPNRHPNRRAVLNNLYPTVIPYPGELYILNKLLDAIIDVNGEQAVDEHSKLFMVGLRSSCLLFLARTKHTAIIEQPSLGAVYCVALPRGLLFLDCCIVCFMIHVYIRVVSFCCLCLEVDRWRTGFAETNSYVAAS